MNQHYVPRSYLKNFAIKRGKEYFVEVYDKINNRYFESNIKKICSEVDIYTLAEDNPITKDKFLIEKIYANGIEPLYIRSYEILTNNNIFWVSDLQRAEILISVLQLHLRNPRYLTRATKHHQTQIESLYNNSIKQNKKGLTYLDEDFSFREWSKESIIAYFREKVTKEFKEKHLAAISEILNIHETAIIDVVIIKDSYEFITSDNPLVFDDQLTKDENPFLKSKEFIIALNKKFALRLYHDNRKKRNRIYRAYIPNGSATIMNKLILDQSSRFAITNKVNLDECMRISTTFLEDTSLELKIDSIRQIISKFEPTNETRESMDVMKYYLKKYDEVGTLTDLEEFEMCQKLRAIGNAFVRKIIS